tara:strand:+ start:17 stop:1081 length:1065 start_codon:yes stop_codon:yes gene_type:complete
MGSVTRFAAINTKIRALEGQLLRDKDYQMLLEMSDLSEMVSYLKNKTSYKTALQAVETEEVSIDGLEVIFRKTLFMKLQGFIHYFVDEYKKLFRILFMRYEVEDLKLFIRALDRSENLENLLSHMVILGVGKSFDYEALIQATSLEDLVDALEGTPYQELIRYYLDEPPERRTFYIEMNLDRYYFRQLGAQVDKLSPDNRKPMKEILGKNTDILNLQWVYRGRRFYNLSSEELLNYTLMGGHTLKYKTLKKLCYAKSMEEALGYIKDSHYGFLVENQDFEVFMELNMERYIYNEFMKLKKSNHMNIIESMVYMHQIEYEVRDLFAIFEAKRYGFEKSEIQKYLVRTSHPVKKNV